MSTSNFILLGGDGYFGRNFAYYLAEKEIKFIVVDKREYDDTFWGAFPLKNNLIKYIQLDLKKEESVETLDETLDEYFTGIDDLNGKYDSFHLINFAATSFVDDCIADPNKSMSNNVKCCINGLNVAKNHVAYITDYTYISTDEVNVMKSEGELSPYVISKRKCEDFLKDRESVKIMRPVNLMDVMIPGVSGLRQKNNCLLKILSEKPSHVYIHGKGEQMRMFMKMRVACEELFKFVLGSEKMLDITLHPELRTTNIKIRDIVHYLSAALHYNYSFIKDPRGQYQDYNYCVGKNHKPYSFYTSTRDIAIILESVKRMSENSK